MSQGDAETAQQRVEQAIALHTANNSRYDVALDLETLAQAQLALDDIERAMTSLRKAADLYAEIALLDRAASALTGLGDILDNAGRKEDALAVYAAIVALLPTEAMWRRNYANSLINLNRLDEAAGELDEAERLDPGAPYLALRRAELARAREDRGAAAQWAQEALRRQPDWEEAQEILTWATNE